MNISLGDACSKVAYEWAQETFSTRQNRPGMLNASLPSSFANLVYFGSQQIAIASDGIGTKIELAERTGIYDTLGFDLVAMVIDDIVCVGAIPTNLSNILDVDNLDNSVVDALMRGLHCAAQEASIAVTGGEIAELGARIGGYGQGMHFNWCATGIGYLPEGQQPLDGSQIHEGDIVLALRSRGFRSNGFSLIRSIMQQAFGNLWHEEEYQPGMTWGEILLTPSRLYTPGIVDLFENNIVPHGIVHVTGGSVAGNLRRILRNNHLGADLPELCNPFPVMKALQSIGGVSEEQAYELWNMGNGMLVIVDEKDAEVCKRCLEMKDYQVQCAGTVIKEPQITIVTKSLERKILKYKLW